MRNFDYSFLKETLVPSKFINLIAGISSLKTLTEVRKEGYSSAFDELEAVSRLRSVKHAGIMDGAEVDDSRIFAIVNRGSEPKNQSEWEISSYKDALNTVNAQYDELNINETNIKSIHKTMMRIPGYKLGGKYKSEDNYVTAEGVSGKPKVKFIPTPAEGTKESIKHLTAAYAKALNDENINELLLIPCFILDFLCIYPFEDGNEKMALLLSSLLLYKNGYDIGKYISFEEIVSLNQENYRSSIWSSSEAWHENKNSYFPFIESFLSNVYMCYKELDNSFQGVSGSKVTKTARIEATVLNSLTPISKSEICSALPDVSVTTVEVVLGKMLKDKKITKIGGSRNIKYIKAEKRTPYRLPLHLL